MARYRNIHTSFWGDRKVSEDFTPEDKYFMLYLLTNDHTRITGCYELGAKVMAYELGYSVDSVKALIERMQDVHKVIAYNSETGELLILNWWKYNWARSPKLVAAVERDAKSIKFKAFREYVERSIEAFANGEEEIRYGYGIDTVSIPFTDTDTDTDISDTDSISKTDSDSNIGSVSKKDAFLAATLNGICPQCKHNSMHQRPSDDGRLVWECHNGCEVSWISEVSNG